MKRNLGAPMSEGLLCLKFHFSLTPGVPVELHLFSSHWLVNRGLTPLVAHAGNPVDADAALSGSEVSGVIGGADIAVRSAIKGVTGIVTKPLEVRISDCAQSNPHTNSKSGPPARACKRAASAASSKGSGKGSMARWWTR